MNTPREKYRNDPEYRSLVDMLEHAVETARFTPSELREAAVLACINYEMRHARGSIAIPRAAEAFRVLDEFTTHRPSVPTPNLKQTPKGEEMTMGNTWEVAVWKRLEYWQGGECSDVIFWRGQSLIAAAWNFVKAKREGHGCVTLRWS